MKRHVEIEQSREWAMALSNLEQMHPRYLASLLNRGSLANVLRERVTAYFKTLDRLRQANPTEDEMNLKEIAQPEHLTPTNPNWQEEPPLSVMERRMLDQFRSQNET
jgi:hypothetical protein